MHSTDIVAYSYDAAIHCVECTMNKFNNNPDNAEDSEGNPIHPVFASDEGWENDCCDDCSKLIIDTI